MTNFNDLPYELLLMIARRLKNKVNDFTSFRAVSKSLRGVSKKDYFDDFPLRQGIIPYLLLPVRDDSDDIREFYNFFFKDDIPPVVAPVQVPSFKTKKCYESLGCLLLVDKDGSMTLLDPFCGNQFSLPHLMTFADYTSFDSTAIQYQFNFGPPLAHIFIRKMVLSSRPSESNSNFILMVIGRSHKHLAIWRLGDEAWTFIIDDNDEYRIYMDIVYGGGEQFYAIDLSGYVKVFNFAGNGTGTMTIINSERLPVSIHGCVYILTTLKDSLLIIARIPEDLVLNCYDTKKFRVFEVDIATGTWKEIHSLGSLAVFVGNNSSIAVDASKFRGGVIKANCIYFTGDSKYLYPGAFFRDSATDNGVYDMETRCITPICLEKVTSSKVSPPLWITPSFPSDDMQT